MQKITAALLITGTLGTDNRPTDGRKLRLIKSSTANPTYLKQDPITYPSTAAEFIASNPNTQHLIKLQGAITPNTISDNEAKTNISDIKYNKYSDSIYINDYSSDVNDNKSIKINDHICGFKDNKYIKDFTYINGYSSNIDILKKLYDDLIAATSIQQALIQYEGLKAKITKPLQYCTIMYLTGEECSTPIENGEVIQAAMDLLAKVNATDFDDFTKYIILAELKDLIKIDAKRFDLIKFEKSSSTILPVIQRITNALGHASDDIAFELGRDQELQELSGRVIDAMQEIYRAPHRSAAGTPDRQNAVRNYNNIFQEYANMKKIKTSILTDKTIATLGIKLLEDVNKIIKEELKEEKEPKLCSDEDILWHKTKLQ